TDRVTVIIVRAKFALAEAAYRCGSAVKKAFVDRNLGRFVGAAGCKRMDNAGTRAKRDRRLANPSLETIADGLIVNHAGCKWLWSKRTIIADSHRASDEFDVATKAARCGVD